MHFPEATVTSEHRPHLVHHSDLKESKQSNLAGTTCVCPDFTCSAQIVDTHFLMNCCYGLIFFKPLRGKKYQPQH